ncbi:roadblock/LC7 domain-containing protein [Streptomyces sp. NPDC059740]|uniref:roadblock/LC7 domain-containing protein n=1 Tax=Streptomyces sp. NPDC059740 TaxID=3346926 RepID=UPI00364CF64A
MTTPQATGAEPAPRRPGGLGWLLDDFATRVGGVQAALVLSGDGLATGATADLAPEDAEQLAALASALHSLADGVGHRFGAGTVRQTMVELDGAYLFVSTAGEGSRLAVLSDTDTDVGRVAYEMTLLVRRVGTHLATAART